VVNQMLSHAEETDLQQKQSPLQNGKCTETSLKHQFELNCFEETPTYLTYPFILNGYRNNFSIKLCVKSIFKFHNETGNIWTHLLAFLSFIGLFIYTFGYILRPDDPFQDKMFFFVFLVGVLFNFATSAGYHTFHCHSLTTCLFVAKLDFAGISNHICCSWLLLANYLFHDDFILQSIYIFLISSHSIFMLLSPKLVSDSHIARVTIFATMALFGILPIAHWVFVKGWNSHEIAHIFWMIPFCWLIYAIGLIVFLTRVPERFSPGSFDNWFNSHQIWHCFVWAGNAWFYWIIVTLATYHHQHICTVSS